MTEFLNSCGGGLLAILVVTVSLTVWVAKAFSEEASENFKKFSLVVALAGFFGFSLYCFEGKFDSSLMLIFGLLGMVITFCFNMGGEWAGEKE